MNVEIQNENNHNFEPQTFSDQAPRNAEKTESAAHDEAASSVDPASAIGDKVKELEDELQDYKDRYLRNLADMENMRKRHERDRVDLLKYASEKLLQDILPVLDSFEKAVQVSVNGASDPIVDGVRMVHKQFLQILENHGLKSIEATGKPFDPNFHQAIQRVEGEDVQEETVKDEFQKGYTLNGRLVRPSMVSVFVPKSSGHPEVS